MSVVQVPKRPEKLDTWPKLGWWRDPATGEIWVACPKGHLGGLDHVVADDGSVSPSLECPEKDCGWHVNARLVDWDGGGTP